ncbi:MAG: hypothetical protein GY749_34550 [Desulfobacteraceae bacterium]|nr:hypothetical protein [Desulfobacteraceae bacterium]
MEIEKILEDLLTGTQDVTGVAVIDMDGLLIASALPEETDEGNIAAMSASILSIGEKTVTELWKGDISRILIEGEDGYILLVQAGEDSMLLVMTRKKIKLGMLFFMAKHAAKKIESALKLNF